MTLKDHNTTIIPLPRPKVLEGEKYYIGWSNPSIAYNPYDKLFYCCVRNTNYILRRNRGKITYCASVAKDRHYETINYIGTSPDPITTPFTFRKVNDIPGRQHYSDKWGLEDARLVFWNNIMYLSGTRRDHNTGMMGRIECELIQDIGGELKVGDFYRWDGLDNDCTYCEKNWMPLNDRPFIYMTVPDPVVVSKCNLSDWHLNHIVGKDVYHMSTNLPGTMRGSSQLVPYKDGYICVLHAASLDETGQMQYNHCFRTYDKNFNVINTSKLFKFEGEDVEFCCGMCYKDNTFYISYSLMDDNARIMVLPEEVVMNLLNQQDVTN